MAFSAKPNPGAPLFLLVSQPHCIKLVHATTKKKETQAAVVVPGLQLSSPMAGARGRGQGEAARRRGSVNDQGNGQRCVWAGRLALLALLAALMVGWDARCVDENELTDSFFTFLG